MYVLSDLAIMRDRHVNRMPAVEPHQGVRGRSEGAFFKTGQAVNCVQNVNLHYFLMNLQR